MSGAQGWVRDPAVLERFRAELDRVRRQAEGNPRMLADLDEMKARLAAGAAVYVIGDPSWAAATPEEAATREAALRADVDALRVALARGEPPEAAGWVEGGAVREYRRRRGHRADGGC